MATNGAIQQLWFDDSPILIACVTGNRSIRIQSDRETGKLIPLCCDHDVSSEPRRKLECTSDGGILVHYNYID
jgi:hypothetical protein